MNNLTNLTCPIPITDYPQVTLAHGGGGKLTHQLIEKMFASTFQNDLLNSKHDGAVFTPNSRKLAFTTDSYVVHPMFFPGGDIGSMAVFGTVNDLAMCGAKPLYLSCGFIIEEGLAMEDLWKIVRSMQTAALKCGVQIVTGDTKVVDKGKGDGIFINTAGIGEIDHDLVIAPSSVKPGDRIILNGDIGRHGIAIMAKREGLEFESSIESDSAPLVECVMKLLKSNIKISCMRDLTRGGLAGALNEIALSGMISVNIEEARIPVREDVQGACEMLGLDPMYVANEGRFVVFVPQNQADEALKIMSGFNSGIESEAGIIGEVGAKYPGLVTMKNKIGTSRVLDLMTGEQLPRIC